MTLDDFERIGPILSENDAYLALLSARVESFEGGDHRRIFLSHGLWLGQDGSVVYYRDSGLGGAIRPISESRFS